MNKPPVDTDEDEMQIAFSTQFLSGTSREVVLQDMSSGCYLGNGSWTTEIESAIGFNSSRAALEAAQQLRLASVQIALRRL